MYFYTCTDFLDNDSKDFAENQGLRISEIAFYTLATLPSSYYIFLLHLTEYL